MYGLILENIASYLRNKYGDLQFKEIAFMANVEVDHFNTDQVYPEGMVHRLIWAAQDVTGEPQDEMLEHIGHSFYTYLTKYDYHKIIRVLGRTFPEFLNGLDNLHEYLKFSYPKLKPPSFYCEHESRTGLTLHYRSKRRGFLHYVKGIIHIIGKTLYDTDVKIELLDHENEDNMEHIIMRLHFNNHRFTKRIDTSREDLIRQTIKITGDVFFNIFPFIVVFNRGMRVRNIGLGLLRLMPKLIGKRISQMFVLTRPLIRFRWEEIMLYSNNIFELTSVEQIWEDDKMYVSRASDDKELQEERRRMVDEERRKFLCLKGQMLYMEEWESICFLGIPVMIDLVQMYKTGIFINDYALHDSSRDLVLASTQQAAELKLLLDQEAQKSEKMESTMQNLKAEREKTDALLYQLLPKAVADQLRGGGSAVGTCETFDEVTIIFTDVVGFTTICSGITPMAVVNFLNQMYSTFDKLSDDHGVFKVETIGDAYMVASGAPTRTEYHAELAADCAMDLITACESMTEASSGQNVRIRAGLHTGSVVAGVVGIKMPRYCLFGDTVHIANKMESTGKPMRVQISETTKKALSKLKPAHLYNFSDGQTVEVSKDTKGLKTFYLESKNGPARIPEFVEEDTHAQGRSDSMQSVYRPVSETEIESYSRAQSVAE